MPRAARIVIPGVPIHAIQRGNNRSACFADDEDREFYLSHLGRLLGDEACALHAYCLMTNHVHLLLTPGREQSCARLFKRLGLLHTQYMNRKYGRTGTLWEGRFRSCIVQSEGYLLACHRYIEMNPVRAGMVQAPGAYRWSSYRSNAEGATNEKLSPHAEYVALGSCRAECRREYQAMFGSEIPAEQLEEIRSATIAGLALGSERFRREMSVRLGRRLQPGERGRPCRGRPAMSSQIDLI